jgi:hypothetical protein
VVVQDRAGLVVAEPGAGAVDHGQDHRPEEEDLPPVLDPQLLVSRGEQLPRRQGAVAGQGLVQVGGRSRPEATLFNNGGQAAGTHFAGPTWQANDGSKVVGSLVSSVPVSPNAIPWLLLSATDTPAPGGGGLLADTTFVQRVFTVGGLAPAASTCNAARVGVTAEVPYSSEYVFWRK